MKLILRKIAVAGILIALSVSEAKVTAQIVMVEGIPRDTSFTAYGTYIKESKRRPELILARPQTDGLSVYNNVVYRTLEQNGLKRELRLDIFRPEGTACYPAILMIHGGGWNSGDKSMQWPLATELAKRGYITIAVEYRLIPEALYPAGIDDVERAIDWVHKNGTEYGIDVSSLYVSGCSAGGQLAMLAGMRNVNALLKGVLNIDGISTFIEPTTVDRSEKAYAEGKQLPVDAIWLGGPYSVATENWESASALNHITADSPPVCFINSSQARFHNGREEAMVKLGELGKYTVSHTFGNTPHPFWLFEQWCADTAEFMADFLRRVNDSE